jgi:hypothetical protein
MRKKIILTILICWFGLSAGAQIIYRYDKAGNRKYRGTDLTVTNGRMEAKDSLANANLSFSIQVFPNPTSNVLNIAIQNYPADSVSAYKLVSMNGVSIVSKKISKGDNSEDLASYPTGLYILQVSVGKNRKEFKILKE